MNDPTPERLRRPEPVDDALPYLAMLCVSRCTGTTDDIAAALRAGVPGAVAHNRARGRTGALICTGEHLVEVLEVARDCADTSHAFVSQRPQSGPVVFIDTHPIGQRRFPDWGCAYSGASQFVSGHVTRLLSARTPDEQRRAAARLMDLVYEFALDQCAAERRS